MSLKNKLLFASVAICTCATRSVTQEIQWEVSGSQRAGNPQEIARLAHPSNSPGAIGYYVGGGAFSYRKGDAPLAEEGTWGWDYRGWWVPRRVNLLWWHGQRSQGGIGAYKTDGPKLPAIRAD